MYTGRMALPSVDTRVEQEVSGLVAGLNQRLDAHVRRTAETLGITASQAVALRELSSPMTLTALATRMCCETSNAGYVVDRMQEQGLIERRVHPEDRRAKLIALTPAGARCRGNVLTGLAVGSPVDTLNADEQRHLADLLRRALDA